MAGNAEPQIALQAASGLAADLLVADAGADRPEVMIAFFGSDEFFFAAFKITEAVDVADPLVSRVGRREGLGDVAVAAQILIDLDCCVASRSHRLDDGLCAVDCVAGCEDAGHAGGKASFGGSGDAVAAAPLKSGILRQIGPLADCEDNGVALDDVLGIFFLDRTGESIVRCSFDGRIRERITGNRVKDFNIAGSWIFYHNENDGGSLWSVRLDGANDHPVRPEG